MRRRKLRLRALLPPCAMPTMGFELELVNLSLAERGVSGESIEERLFDDGSAELRRGTVSDSSPRSPFSSGEGQGEGTPLMPKRNPDESPLRPGLTSDTLDLIKLWWVMPLIVRRSSLGSPRRLELARRNSTAPCLEERLVERASCMGRTGFRKEEGISLNSSLKLFSLNLVV